MGRKNKPKEGVRSYRFHMAVTIPSGRCPVKLESVDKQAVKDWIISLIDLKPVGYGYEPTVFKYYSRHFYEVNKEEYKQVCKHVDSLLQGKTIFSPNDLPFSK